jgi:hypothetical protein
VLLVLLLLVGALARVWNLGYGLPHVYHPDEGHVVNRAVRFHGGDLDPRFFNWPSLYMYLLSGLYGLVFGIFQEGGVIEAFTENPTLVYLIGRLVTAVLGTATIAVVYVLGAEIYGVTVGVVASLFLAVDLLHIRDSHYITTDVPLTFLVAVAVLFVVRYWRSGRARHAVLAGLFTGLGASMKYPGGLTVLPLLLAHVWRPGTGPASWRGVARPALLGAGAAAVLGFLAGTPYAVLTPVAFLRGVLSELREVHSVQFGNEADLPGYLFHLLHSLPEGMGVATFVLALAGVVLALASRTRAALILLAFPLPYFVVIGAWSSRFERYVLPLLPFLAVLAAHALVTAAVGLRARVRLPAVWRPGFGVALAVCLVVAPELARVVRFHVLLSRPDTRVLAGEWIEREIPWGARIAMEPYSPAVRLSPAMIRAERAGLTDSVGHTVVRNRFDRFLASPEGQRERGYWLSRLNTYDLKRLLERDVEYVVLSGFTYQRYRRACGRYPEACRFYEDLERRGTLVYSVDAGVGREDLWVGDIYSPLTRLAQRTRPGPSIKIYQLPAS